MVHLFVLAFAFLSAQQADDLSIIEGQVLDKLTSNPIAGARVIGARIDKPGLGIGPGVLQTKPSEGAQDPQANQAAVLTGPDGKFRLRFQGAVKCMIFVHAEGYVKPQAGIYPENMFEAKPGSPKSDVVLRLSRALSISGRVIDAETDQPVPGLSVTAMANRATRMGSFLSPSGSDKSDSEGRFKIEGIEPGEYYLEVRPSLGAQLSKVRPIEEFRNDNEKTYVKSWYPDVTRIEEALPVKMPEGAPIEGVDIRITKRKAGSIRGRVLGDASGGPADAVLSVHGVELRLNGRSFSSIANGKIKIGDEFEIDHLNPFSGYLTATVSGEKPKYARMSIAVGEDNQEGLLLHLRPTVSVSGHLRLEGREQRPDEPALPSDSVRISLRPVLNVAGLNSGEPVPVAKQDGSFSIGGLVTDKYYARVTGAPAGYELSEVRYNGRVCPFGMVPVDAGGEEQKLDVLLGKSGSITATITDGSNPLPKAILVLAPEAADPDVLYPGYALKVGNANQEGKYAFAGLVPGVYRLIAYQPGTPWADDPRFRQRLASGERVELTGAQQATVQLRAASLP